VKGGPVTGRAVTAGEGVAPGVPGTPATREHPPPPGAAPTPWASLCPGAGTVYRLATARGQAGEQLALTEEEEGELLERKARARAQREQRRALQPTGSLPPQSPVGTNGIPPPPLSLGAP